MNNGALSTTFSREFRWSCNSVLVAVFPGFFSPGGREGDPGKGAVGHTQPALMKVSAGRRWP
jgi:hypothetical protein